MRTNYNVVSVLLEFFVEHLTLYKVRYNSTMNISVKVSCLCPVLCTLILYIRLTLTKDTSVCQHKTSVSRTCAAS